MTILLTDVIHCMIYVPQIQLKMTKIKLEVVISKYAMM